MDGDEVHLPGPYSSGNSRSGPILKQRMSLKDVPLVTEVNRFTHPLSLGQDMPPIVEGPEHHPSVRDHPPNEPQSQSRETRGPQFNGGKGSDRHEGYHGDEGKNEEERSASEEGDDTDDTDEDEDDFASNSVDSEFIGDADELTHREHDVGAPGNRSSRGGEGERHAPGVPIASLFVGNLFQRRLRAIEKEGGRMEVIEDARMSDKTTGQKIKGQRDGGNGRNGEQGKARKTSGGSNKSTEGREEKEDDEEDEMDGDHRDQDTYGNAGGNETDSDADIDFGSPSHPMYNWFKLGYPLFQSPAFDQAFDKFYRTRGKYVARYFAGWLGVCWLLTTLLDVLAYYSFDQGGALNFETTPFATSAALVQIPSWSLFAAIGLRLLGLLAMVMVISATNERHKQRKNRKERKVSQQIDKVEGIKANDGNSEVEEGEDGKTPPQVTQDNEDDSDRKVERGESAEDGKIGCLDSMCGHRSMSRGTRLSLSMTGVTVLLPVINMACSALMSSIDRPTYLLITISIILCCRNFIHPRSSYILTEAVLVATVWTVLVIGTADHHSSSLIPVGSSLALQCLLLIGLIILVQVASIYVTLAFEHFFRESFVSVEEAAKREHQVRCPYYTQHPQLYRYCLSHHVLLP